MKGRRTATPSHLLLLLLPLTITKKNMSSCFTIPSHGGDAFRRGASTSLWRSARRTSPSRQASSVDGRAVSPSFSSTNATANDDAWIVSDFEESFPYREDRVVTGPAEVIIYDTSLRDGTQGESISVSCSDKIKIATRLSSFGVDYIEAGWPGSNPKDAEFFARAKTELSPSTKRKLVAFGSTRRKATLAEDDPQMVALVESDAPTICMVAKGHKWQVTDILRATPEENLEMIEDSVRYLRDRGRRVFVDLEHFFDGFKFNEDYTMRCCEAAVKAGASGLVLCDTNGGSMPWEVEEITKAVVSSFGTRATVGIHCHNDCGMAVANSLSSLRSGAGLVQGTINGIGERTGNADLCSIVPSLALHMKSKVTCADRLEEITGLSRYVDELMNRNPNPAAPYVGMSAFAHKGGLHVSAMERNPLSYQHIEPTLVGNEKRVLVSELSGRQNIMDKIKETGVTFGDEDSSERALAILNRIKALESIGYTFEGADASVHIMILHASSEYCPPFTILDYSTTVFETEISPEKRSLVAPKEGVRSRPSKGTTRATINIRSMGQGEYDTLDDMTTAPPFSDILTVSDGDGPIDALAKALTKALVPSNPLLSKIELIDYKVRILDPESATGAATRVMIEFCNKESEETWTTVSVDRNVISASLNALVDGFEYALLGSEHLCLLEDDDFGIYKRSDD